MGRGRCDLGERGLALVIIRFCAASPASWEFWRFHPKNIIFEESRSTQEVDWTYQLSLQVLGNVHPGECSWAGGQSTGGCKRGPPRWSRCWRPLQLASPSLSTSRPRTMILLLLNPQYFNEMVRRDGVNQCKLHGTYLAFGGRLHGALCSSSYLEVGQTKRAALPETGDAFGRARKPLRKQYRQFAGGCSGLWRVVGGQLLQTGLLGLGERPWHLAVIHWRTFVYRFCPTHDVDLLESEAVQLNPPLTCKHSSGRQAPDTLFAVTNQPEARKRPR